MKKLLFIFVLSTVLFSCKKEIISVKSNSSLLNNIRLQLKDSIAIADFINWDFDSVSTQVQEKKNLTIWRIPFINKNISTDFVLLKIENNQRFSFEKIININRN